MYAALFRAFSQLGQNSYEGHDFTPFFSKHFVVFGLTLYWRAVVNPKNKFNNNLRQGLLFLNVYFLFSIFHSNRPKKRGKENRASKNPLFFVLKISFIQWGINETITRLSWKFEENRTSGRNFIFQTKKKEYKKWNPLYNYFARSGSWPWPSADDLLHVTSPDAHPHRTGKPWLKPVPLLPVAKNCYTETSPWKKPSKDPSWTCKLGRKVLALC